MMTAPTIFASRLKQARLQAGLTQMQLGVAAHIDEYSASARINQYERGKHWPDFGTEERLAKVMGIPAAFFYATDDALAEWIFKFDRLNARNRARLLKMADDLAEGTPGAEKSEKRIGSPPSPGRTLR
ncbi:MAG: helix-turn-helix domain-containing protein [Candidatus Accumulibacter sp.]|jgi:transcriptional regulator with XRE-family HTH domain|nr:helix-turn-helix domain-containing protein [Accumulibacter sp.]